MDASRSQFAIKLLPSFTDFAFLMPILYLFGRMNGATDLLSDCDTGWHIRTGDWILANRAVPVHDLFSYSKAGEPWYAWEWLTDVLWSWLNAHGGLAAVVLFSALMISVTFTLLFRLTRRKADPLVAIGITMVAAASSSIHWLARPHLFTLLFSVLFYMALESVRAGRGRVCGVPRLALLPVAMILWTNLHGGFFMGIVLVGAYGAGEILRAAFAADSGERAGAWRSARGYLLSAAGCLAATLVNPYGYGLHAHVYKYLLDPYHRQNISEFLSLSFQHPLAVFFEVLLLAGVAAACWHLSRRRFIEPLLILVWAHGALISARNIPLFAIVVAPPLAAAIQECMEWLAETNAAGWLRAALRRFRRVSGEVARTDEIGRWRLASALGAVVVVALLYAPSPPAKFRAEFDPKSFPVAAVETLRGDSSSRIFAHDQWSDYLIYRFYPQGRVFVDGRSDFYGAEFEKNVGKIRNVKYGWEKILNRFGVDTMLLPPASPLAGALKECSRWRLVYDDGIALVFRKADRAAGETIPTVARGVGKGRDREITKIEASDRAITTRTSTL
jgi:hypothetical protein